MKFLTYLLQFLLGSLLDESEASELLLHPCQLTISENDVLDGQEAMVIIAMIAFRAITLLFFIFKSGKLGTHLANLLESSRFCEEWRKLL